MIAFNAVQLVASLQHAVELVDEHGNRLVTFLGLNGRVHVRSLNRDVTLGLELDSDRGIAITLQFNPHPDDAFFVAKQPFGFLPDERLQGRCQVEVNAGYDYIVIVLAVHVSAYGFGCNKAGTQPGLA
jgi:hypothetical protein